MKFSAALRQIFSIKKQLPSVIEILLIIISLYVGNILKGLSTREKRFLREGKENLSM
jgi:hypothetical protein